MSTDHHPSDQPPHDGCPPCGETRYVDRAPSAPAHPARDVRARADLEGTRTDLQRSRTNLESRIERARLRVRVAALERSLEAQERRRQAIVDQYETVLERREYRFPGPTASGPQDAPGADPSSDETSRDETDSSDDETPLPLRLIPSALRSLFP